MSNWKLHTPNGVNDILPDECAVKKEIESTIWSVFSSIGYKEVETPTFEYYDCYLGLSGQISQEHMFKFYQALPIRPDIQTVISVRTQTPSHHFSVYRKTVLRRICHDKQKFFVA